MIDLHAHILPGVDDGPATLEDSFAMARAAVATGTRVMATTSHVSGDVVSRVAPADLPHATVELARELSAAGIGLELRTGAEVAASKVPDLDDDTLRGLTLGGGPYLLLECPFATVAPEMEPVVSDLLRREYRVLLAHPERCAAFQREPRRLRRLVDAGALVQVTGVALTGAFGGSVRRFALALLREGLVHVIASDAHDVHVRPPGLTAGAASAAREVKGLDTQVPWLTEAVPAAILAGEPIPPRPPRPRPAGLRAPIRPRLKIRRA